MISQILFVFSKVLLVKDDDEEDTNVDTREANTKVCFTANCSLLLPGADWQPDLKTSFPSDQVFGQSPSLLELRRQLTLKHVTKVHWCLHVKNCDCLKKSHDERGEKVIKR